MQPDNRQLLLDGLAQLNLEPAPERVEALVGYHDFLQETNASLNLTGLRDERESVIGNLLNALAPHRFVRAKARTADIGSGGGLPGIPLAIMLGMSSMTLVESKRKKCDFLVEACRRFCPKVRVHHGNANEISVKVDQVVSSAFGTLGKLLIATRSMRMRKSRVLAYKGRRATIETELAELPAAERRWILHPFEVPFMPDVERYLCEYPAPTPSKG
jgi:16S rRNA (guanine527-N7)-methyltransferase